MARFNDPTRRLLPIPGDLRMAGSIGPRIPITGSNTGSQPATSGSLQNLQLNWSSIGPNQGILVEYFVQSFFPTADVTGSLSIQNFSLILSAALLGVAPFQSFFLPAFNQLVNPASKVPGVNTLIFAIAPFFMSYEDIVRSLNFVAGNKLAIAPIAQAGIFNTSAGAIAWQQTMTFFARVVSEVEEVT